MLRRQQVWKICLYVWEVCLPTTASMLLSILFYCARGRALIYTGYQSVSSVLQGDSLAHLGRKSGKGMERSLVIPYFTTGWGFLPVFRAVEQV